MIQDRLVINIQIQDHSLDIDPLQETDTIEENEIDTSPVFDLPEMAKDIVNVIEIVTEVDKNTKILLCIAVRTLYILVKQNSLKTPPN